MIGIIWSSDSPWRPSETRIPFRVKRKRQDWLCSYASPMLYCAVHQFLSVEMEPSVLWSKWKAIPLHMTCPNYAIKFEFNPENYFLNLLIQFLKQWIWRWSIWGILIRTWVFVVVCLPIIFPQEASYSKYVGQKLKPPNTRWIINIFS